jgi:type II secretory pathway pseudopilin PulG
MINPSVPTPLRTTRTFTPRRLRAFTVVELALVLLCLMLAGYIALSVLRKFQHRAQRDEFVVEVRSLAAAFESYQTRTGDSPAATNAEARIPRGMESALAGTRWLAGPPFGGTYEWIPAPRPKLEDEEAAKKPAPGGMIAVTAFAPEFPLPLTPADLIYLDGKLDDGNLATGRFRTGFNGWPVFLVTKNR